MVDLTWKESFEVLAVIARKEKEKELGLINYYGIKVEDFRGADRMPIVTVWASPSVPIKNIIIKVKTPEEIKHDLDMEYFNAEKDYDQFREEHHDLKKLTTGPKDIRNLERLRLRIINAQNRMRWVNKAIGDWHMATAPPII